jgi:hypothetical protein
LQPPPSQYFGNTQDVHAPEGEPHWVLFSWFGGMQLVPLQQPEQLVESQVQPGPDVGLGSSTD